MIQILAMQKLTPERDANEEMPWTLSVMSWNRCTSD